MISTNKSIKKTFKFYIHFLNLNSKVSHFTEKKKIQEIYDNTNHLLKVTFFILMKLFKKCW